MMSHMLAKGDRIERIADLVLRQGEVGLDELAQQLGVSRMTIHRDLEVLEGRGVLRKVRNGATARPSSAFESNFEFRAAQAAAAKERLAAQAAALIEPGDVILLDEATTLLPMIPLLEGIEGLTVVSNFLPVQDAVARFETVRLIALSGEYIRQYHTFGGPLCEAAVGQLRINRYFTSTTAIDGAAAYHPNSLIASTKKAMMRSAVRSYLLADASKFARTALHKVADLDDFELILTDQPPPRDHAEQLRPLAGKLVVAGPPTPAEQGQPTGA